MKKIIFVLMIASFKVNALNVKIHVHNSIRQIAGESTSDSENDEKSVLVYDSPDSKSKNKITVIDEENWNSLRISDGTRFDFLIKMYYANIKDFSNSGQRHLGCFFGDAEKVANSFFKSSVKISYVDEMNINISEDRKMMGIEFNYTNPNPNPNPNQKATRSSTASVLHFRLPHCMQGAKNILVSLDQIKTTHYGFKNQTRSVANTSILRLPSAAAADEENGYDTYDKISKTDLNAEDHKILPRFKLCADYNQIKPKPESRPWKGMDISTEAGGQKFAQTVLDYFYDSLVQDPQNTNNNFIAQNISKDKTRWCHMPWLNVGDSGRELIHGLTKERDLETSDIYPEAATTKDLVGSDWGIGFYNDIACVSMHNVFGSTPNPNLKPDFINKKFPDGSVSVKILFTTANLKALEGSFTWTANVSHAKSTARKLRPVKMIQIDVAVKDSTLIGSKKEVDHWVMTTFYYDASFLQKNSKHKYTENLAGLLKMRPVGIQTGFDPSTSMIFAGSQTNSANNTYYGAKPMLMNGPADNPKGSCMSCHGAAGTSVKMVPGIKDFEHYEKVKAKGLDFSQQMALAKRNYETRIGQKKK